MEEFFLNLKGTEVAAHEAFYNDDESQNNTEDDDFELEQVQYMKKPCPNCGDKLYKENDYAICMKCKKKYKLKRSQSAQS